ncbi:MAG TPA: zf-HC2 domain-containing protein [Polyangiaceae bacterium]|nr:zf-HC2 domain-containing protein [Polyangiaceae bacterium]
MTTPCRSVARLVETYLDGELEPSQLLEVETHTQGCATCRERIVLDRAIRAGVRRTVAANEPSDAFRARAAASMMAQRWAPSGSGRDTSGLRAWGWPLAAAAAFAIFSFQGQRQDSVAARLPREATAHASIGLDAMLDQFVDWHARPLPPEITNANELSGFEPYVGVPVHPPWVISNAGARLLGGRILPVQDERVTAMLQYTMGSRRISVYVYDPHRVVTSPSRLQTKVVGSEPVYVGHVRGWSVAAAERHGVGYAVASDLGDDEIAEIAGGVSP